MYQQLFNQQQQQQPQQYPLNPPPRPQIENTAPTTTLSQGNIPPFLPGSASLVEQLDRRLLLVLRDGRHIIGILRSFDHFCNLLLEECVERRIKRVENKMIYTDVPLGLFIIRGDTLVLLGEVDDEDSGGMEKVGLEEFDERDGLDESHWVVDFDNDLVV